MIGHILENLNNLQEQLDKEKINTKLMKKELDSKISKLTSKNKDLNQDIDSLYDDLYYLDCRLIHMVIWSSIQYGIALLFLVSLLIYLRKN